MTHRALAQEGPDLRREDISRSPPRRRRHRHKGLARSRSNAVEDSRLGRRYFTGRFCPVHNWPVFRCPPRAWGRVLHDPDLAEAILDRVLERGRHFELRGPSYRTRHLKLDLHHDLRPPSAVPTRLSGNHRPEFPEPTW